MKERVAVDTSDDTHFADEERRIASGGTSSWTAAPAALYTLLTETRLLPSQHERAATSAAVNTLLTPRTTASPVAAPSTLPPDVLTTSAPALPSAPPSAASPPIAQGTASAAVNTLLTDTHMLATQQGKGAASATGVTTPPRMFGNKVMATQNDDIVLCRHGYRCNCIWGCHEGTPLKASTLAPYWSTLRAMPPWPGGTVGTMVPPPMLVEQHSEQHIEQNQPPLARCRRTPAM